jgi:hypothetical protein
MDTAFAGRSAANKGGGIALVPAALAAGDATRRFRCEYAALASADTSLNPFGDRLRMTTLTEVASNGETFGRWEKLRNPKKWP